MRIDNEALGLFLSRDEETVKAVYTRYAGLLRSIAYGILFDKDEANDVMQDTFLKALSLKESDLSDPGAFLTYLCSTARNLALNRLQKRNRFEDGEEAEAEGREDPAYRDDSLFRALRKILGEEEYLVLVLRACEGYRYKEIATSLAINPSTARSLYRRAKEKARTQIDWEKYR